MGPWDAFTQGFGNSFGQALDARNKKKMMAQEQEQLMARLQEQSRLEAQTPTPEMKLMQMYQRNPQGFADFRRSLDPGFATDQAYKMGQLGVAQGNLNLDQQKQQWLMTQPKSQEPTPVMKNYEFLIKSGVDKDKALELLFKPDMMAQVIEALKGVPTIK